MASVNLDTTKITDWPTFHSLCKDVFGFPDFYGSNMNAWIDCLSYLSDSDQMTRFELESDEQLFITVLAFESFTKRLPELSSSLLECVAFVNLRYISCGEPPRLVLVLV